MSDSVPKDDTFDRRKFPRIQTDALVSIARVNVEDVIGHAHDISIGGIRFRCVGLEIDQGEILRVTLNLEGAIVCVVGEVRRVTDLDAFTQEFAISFVEVDAETAIKLEALLPTSFDAV